MSTPSGAATSGDASGQLNTPVGGGAYNPVRVNLEAVIDVSGQVQVFSVPSTTLDNVVVCSVNMPAAALYSGGHGVFELTEPTQGRGDISGYVSNGSSILNGIAEVPIATLGSELQTVLIGQLNAVAANPFAQFSTIGGSASTSYTTYESLGELVLSLYAAYLFGHPAATAAISNDAALVAHINGTDAGQTRAGLNLATAISNLTQAEATNVARAVISQDPNRAVNAPNRVFSAGDGATHIPLIFQPNDVVYVSITVQAPNVSTSNAAGLIGVAGNIANSYPAVAPRFAFEITLE